MATLTVWKFDRTDGASLAVRRLKELQGEGSIVLAAAEEARLREVFGQD